MDDILALADRYATALETGDFEALRRIYAHDVVIWHNSDAIEMTLAEHLSSFSKVHATLRNLKYGERRVSAFTDGFVQQHRVTADTPAGGLLDLYGCLVCRVAEGRIVRMDEYWDSKDLDRAGLNPERPERQGGKGD